MMIDRSGDENQRLTDSLGCNGGCCLMQVCCDCFSPGVLPNRSPGESGTQYQTLETLSLGLQTFSVKDQIAHILGFVNQVVSVTATQLSSAKVDTDNV